MQRRKQRKRSRSRNGFNCRKFTPGTPVAHSPLPSPSVSSALGSGFWWPPEMPRCYPSLRFPPRGASELSVATVCGLPCTWSVRPPSRPLLNPRYTRIEEVDPCRRRRLSFSLPRFPRVGRRTRRITERQKIVWPCNWAQKAQKLPQRDHVLSLGGREW